MFVDIYLLDSAYSFLDCNAWTGPQSWVSRTFWSLFPYENTETWSRHGALHWIKRVVHCWKRVHDFRFLLILIPTFFRSQVYKLNLEQGQFSTAFKTDADESNCCEFNPYHQLFVTGTSNTTVEAWDYRSNTRVGILDCAVEELNEEASIANE